MILFDKLACFGILNTHSSEDKEDESDGIHLLPRISELLQGFTWEICLWEPLEVNVAGMLVFHSCLGEGGLLASVQPA